MPKVSPLLFKFVLGEITQSNPCSTVWRNYKHFSMRVLTETMHLGKKNDQLSLSSKILTKLMRNIVVGDNGNLVVQAVVVVSDI